jgi:NAD(P)H dehydrogenase (quinone)
VNIFLLYWHNEPQSFNGAMFRTAQATLKAAGHDLRISDLCAAQFNPTSNRRNFITVKNPSFLKQQQEELFATEQHGFATEIEAEIQKLEWCELMIWQFPLWWFGLPGVMKGWVDRVFVMGRTYGGGRIYEQGFFRGKRAMLSLTTGGPEQSFQKGGFNGDISAILRPIHRGILQFVGFDVLAPHICYQPARQTDETRKAWLDAYAARLRNIQHESPIEVGEY